MDLKNLCWLWNEHKNFSWTKVTFSRCFQISDRNLAITMPRLREHRLLSRECSLASDDFNILLRLLWQQWLKAMLFRRNQGYSKSFGRLKDFPNFTIWFLLQCYFGKSHLVSTLPGCSQLICPPTESAIGKSLTVHWFQKSHPSWASILSYFLP